MAYATEPTEEHPNYEIVAERAEDPQGLQMITFDEGWRSGIMATGLRPQDAGWIVGLIQGRPRPQRDGS